MNRLLRHGQLEVETDLLLGVEEVLLPHRWRDEAAVAARSMVTEAVVEPKSPAPATLPRAGFEAELFSSRPGRVPVAPSVPAARPPTAASLDRQPVTESLSPSVERTPAPVPASPAEAAAGGSTAVELRDSVPIPPGATKQERLAALEELHARTCPHCTTATAHTRLVFGEGDPDAELVFVGEAPGETEDQLGRPFVGKAGEKLDAMIRAMGFQREGVYIANVLKSRPPDNRTPLAHEIAGCGPYLLAQLAIVAPRAIVTLGGPASKLLLRSELGITRLRGVFGTVEIRGVDGGRLEIPVMPTFHPAYLLRNYTDETRAQVWSDLRKVLELLGRSAPAKR